MGNVQLTETGKFNDTPSLSFMNFAQAKNGGPIALMMKHNSVIVGQKTPYNHLFIFCANGKRYKTIELEPLVHGLSQ